MQDTLIIPVPKAGMDVTLNWKELPEISQEYLINYGARQSLNDAVASVKVDDPDCETLAQGFVGKRVDALTEGTIGTRQGGSTDPLTREIKSICAQRVKGWSKMLADQKNRVIDGIKLANNEKTQAIREEAERRVDAARTLTIDLNDDDFTLDADEA